MQHGRPGVTLPNGTAALDARHDATGRNIILVLDNGPCHVSTATRHALAERDWTRARLLLHRLLQD